MNRNSSFTEKEVLPIYVWPKGASLSGLKEAVLELDLPFKVAPYWFDPGKHHRCIALGDGFGWMADSAYPKSHAAMKAAVEWFFGMRELPQAKTTLDRMQSVFGDDTREVWDWPSQS